MPLSRDPEARRRQLANLRPAPSAPAGNQRAIQHGGYAHLARERLEAKVVEVFDAVSADAPLRGPDGALPAHDAVQVKLLAECLCRLEDLAVSIREYGLRDQKTKNMRPAVELESKLRREAADYLDALGMTPRSRAKLGLDIRRGVDFEIERLSEDELDRRLLGFDELASNASHGA